MPSTLTLHRHNRGIARSWNDGIIESCLDGSDLTILVNDDITFRPNGFDDFVDFINERPDFGLAFLLGFEADGSPHHGEVRSQDFACFAFGRSAFTEVGAFDENFFPAYSEDIDYGHRARRLGLPIDVDARVHVEHARNRTARCVPALREQIERFKAANSAYFRRSGAVIPIPSRSSARSMTMTVPW
ncbi:MAG: hypothetical protein JO278_05135 [Dyella sp.]|nr:hypothetical protein [Dyella sp.]